MPIETIGEADARAIYEQFVKEFGYRLGGSWDNLQPVVRQALPDLIRIARAHKLESETT